MRNANGNCRRDGFVCAAVPSIYFAGAFNFGGRPNNGLVLHARPPPRRQLAMVQAVTPKAPAAAERLLPARAPPRFDELASG
ncbi:MAG: hypothetical protein ACREDJ_01980 [Methylocella sp.]